ncbi:MAG: sulfite exporter TauE/SafE family protein [Isosphaeraceae bacterium]
MGWTDIAWTLLLGGCAGVLSGMFGIGGGLVIVPVLMVIWNLDPKTAVGTSLFALLLPTGLLGVLEYWRRGELRFVPGLLIAFGIFCGAYLGARITGSMSASTMKRVYAVFLIAVAIYFLWTSSPRSEKSPSQPRPAPRRELAELDPGSQPVH